MGVSYHASVIWILKIQTPALTRTSSLTIVPSLQPKSLSLRGIFRGVFNLSSATSFLLGEWL